MYTFPPAGFHGAISQSPSLGKFNVSFMDQTGLIRREVRKGSHGGPQETLGREGLLGAHLTSNPGIYQEIISCR